MTETKGRNAGPEDFGQESSRATVGGDADLHSCATDPWPWLIDNLRQKQQTRKRGAESNVQAAEVR